MKHLKSLLFVLAIAALAVQPGLLSAQTAKSSAVVEKCGVNTFGVSNECGVGAFKNLYFQCYDGYEEKQGETSSCKSSEAWQEYAKSVCANRCGSKQLQQVAPQPPSAGAVQIAVPVTVCAISDSLTREYDGLIAELRKAESAGDKARAADITQKIVALKQEIAKGEQNCQTYASPKLAPAPSVIIIDRCADANRWEEKLAYYRKISGLDDSALKNEYGFSREEVSRILQELETGLGKVKSQCAVQSNLTVGQTEKAPALPQAVAVPLKPVAAQSAQEINTYYKEKLQVITGSEGSAEGQIQELKVLKEEKNLLTEQLIKSRKEIEATELNALEKEVRVTSGQIQAGDVTVNTTTKKVLINVGATSVSIEPVADNVIIREKIEIRTEGVSIEDNKLKVGQVEVKLLASDVAEKIGVVPTAVELKEENAKAVYEMQVSEKRKLFGFISFNVPKTLTADAANGDVLKERLPWYSFLTTK